VNIEKFFRKTEGGGELTNLEPMNIEPMNNEPMNGKLMK